VNVYVDFFVKRGVVFVFICGVVRGQHPTVGFVVEVVFLRVIFVEGVGCCALTTPCV